jgi:hypothetical protein
MPDWKNAIREQISTLRLPTQAKEEIFAELASHLEDGEGDASSESYGSDFSQVKWRRLSREIERAKFEEPAMNNRTKGLWIPAFINLLLTSVVINICNVLGWIDLRIAHPGHIPPALQPWIATLPMCGALAAFLARRGQGSSGMRALAAVAPSLAWLATLPVLQLIFLCFPGTFNGAPPASFASAAVGWFVFPAAALLLGAAPFLRPV